MAVLSRPVTARLLLLLGWLRACAAATSTTASYSRVLDAATTGQSDKPARTTGIAAGGHHRGGGPW